MIRIENVKAYNIARAIYSARNPMSGGQNGWGTKRGDSIEKYC